MKPITSIRVKRTGGPRAEVTVFVNHALAGSLVMRVEEAREFEAALERAEPDAASDAALELEEAWDLARSLVAWERP